MKKDLLTRPFLLKMGRMMGFEPTHKGTTILGLNRLTTSAISLLIHSNTNKILIKKKNKRIKQEKAPTEFVDAINVISHSIDNY